MVEHPDQKKIAPAPPGYPPPALDNRRTNAKVACEQCRKRKSRCLGGIPCEPCVLAKTECEVNIESDGRKKIGLKRKIHDLEQDRSLLVRLVETLRNETRSDASDVLNLIRSNASLDEIRLCVAGRVDLSKLVQGMSSPEQSTLPEAPRASTRRKVMDVMRLADIPSYRVPAQPWTIVTKDDELVSHLISLWFTWNHPCFNFMNRDLFIRDMQSGRLDSTYCSPFLVNIILAEACYYSNYDEIFAVPDDPASRGMHFYDEAKRLLDREEGKITLPTLQGLGSMYVCTMVIGKDRVGWMYVLQSANAAQQLTSMRARMISDAGEGGKELGRTIDAAVMSMFSLTTASSLALQKTAPHRKPRVGPLPEDHDPNDVWQPYPLHLDPVPAHTNCLINAMESLHRVVWDVTNYFFDDDDRPPFPEIEREVEGFYARLQQWSEGLPECIALGTNTTPGIMELHMRYHVTILTIFGFIKSWTTSEGYPADSASHIRHLRMFSAREVRGSLEKFDSQWRIDYMPQNYMQWAAVSLFTLLEDLDNHESLEAFIDLCIFVRSLARRWLLAKGMLRLVQLTATHLGINLPKESQTLFRDFESELWKTDDRERFSSLYPNFALTVLENDGKSVDDAELDRFLEKWDHLTVSPKDEDR